jgi:hypothetical protein
LVLVLVLDGVAVRVLVRVDVGRRDLVELSVAAALGVAVAGGVTAAEDVADVDGVPLADAELESDADGVPAAGAGVGGESTRDDRRRPRLSKTAAAPSAARERY